MSREVTPPQPANSAPGAILTGLEVYRPLVLPEDDPFRELQAKLVQRIGGVSLLTAEATKKPTVPIVHFSDYTRLQNTTCEPITVPEEGLHEFVERQLPGSHRERAQRNVRAAWNGMVYVSEGLITLGVRGRDNVSLYEDRRLIQSAVSQLVPKRSSQTDETFQNKCSARYGLGLVGFDQFLPRPQWGRIKDQVRRFLKGNSARKHIFELGPVEYSATAQKPTWYPKT